MMIRSTPPRLGELGGDAGAGAAADDRLVPSVYVHGGCDSAILRGMKGIGSS